MAWLRLGALGLAAVVSASLVPSAALAAAPPNDLCQGAIVIQPSGPFPYATDPATISDATETGDPPLPDCPFEVPSASRSVWYRFTPDQSGVYILSVCPEDGALTTVEDTVLSVYTSSGGCGGVFAPVADGCNDDGCGPTRLQSRLVLNLAAGQTYYAVAWQYGFIPPEPFANMIQMVVQRFAAPPNNTCAGSIALTLNVPEIGTTMGAANNYQLAAASCYTGIGHSAASGSGREVVYTFTAPAADDYSIKVLKFIAQGDLIVYVAASCPDGGSPASIADCLAAANRNPVSTAESVACLPLAQGQTVYVFVDDATSFDGGSFLIEVTSCRRESEINDFQLGANPVVMGLTGIMESSGDIDFFALGAPPAGSRVFAMVDAEAANLTDFDLRVVTARDTIEFDADNNDAAFGELAPNIAGAVLNGQASYVRVNFKGIVPVEPYGLYAVVQPPMSAATQEIEPNDVTQQAQTGSTLYFAGTLAPPSPSLDADLYAFAAAAGDLVFLGLDADPGKDGTPINAQLDLLDAGGAAIWSVNDLTSQSDTNRIPGFSEATIPFFPAESMAVRIRQSGTYYARVVLGGFTFGPDGAGDYLLSISRNGFIGNPAANRNPTLSGLVASRLPPGGTAVVFGRFADPDLGQVARLIVNWGDGSNETTPYFVNGESEFALPHAFPDQGAAGFTVNIVVEDSAGGSASNAVNVTVGAVQPPTFARIETTTEARARMELVGTPGAAYLIQHSSDADRWQDLVWSLCDNAGRSLYTDTASPAPPLRFYRAVAP